MLKYMDMKEREVGIFHLKNNSTESYFHFQVLLKLK